MHLAHHKSSLVQDFLDSLWLEDGLSDGSVQIYAMYLRNFSRWLEEHRHPPLERITLEAISGFLKAKHRIYSPRTSNLAVTVLKRFFRWAIREKCVLIDPTSRVLLARTGPSFPNCLSERQVQDLLSAIQVDTMLGLRNRAMFELLYASGMRVSELVSLRSINVNLKSRALQIWGKGNKERITIFGEIAHEWLLQYLNEVRPLLIAGTANPYLFVTNPKFVGRKLHIGERWIGKLAKRYAINAGITQTVSPHTLRHSFATHMLDNGAGLSTVQMLLGHESVNSTQIYTHVAINRLKELHRLHHPRG